jgi:hypothetical protein
MEKILKLTEEQIKEVQKKLKDARDEVTAAQTLAAKIDALEPKVRRFEDTDRVLSPARRRYSDDLDDDIRLAARSPPRSHFYDHDFPPLRPAYATGPPPSWGATRGPAAYPY